MVTPIHQGLSQFSSITSHKLFSSPCERNCQTMYGLLRPSSLLLEISSLRFPSTLFKVPPRLYLSYVSGDAPSIDTLNKLRPDNNKFSQSFSYRLIFKLVSNLTKVIFNLLTVSDHPVKISIQQGFSPVRKIHTNNIVPDLIDYLLKQFKLHNGSFP